MGFKLVCVPCRSSFSVGNELEIKNVVKCRNCGKPANILHHKFKPPKKEDKKKWELVELLIENGFDFSSAYIPFPTPGSPVKLQVGYPQTMEEAAYFVKNVKPKGN